MNKTICIISHGQSDPICGDIYQKNDNLWIISKEENGIFSVNLKTGSCCWGVPSGALKLPRQSQVKIIVA